MEQTERKIISNALGFSRPRRWSYRNHYFVYSVPDVIKKMVADGLMAEGEKGMDHSGEWQYFHVTDKGAEAAGLLNRFRKEDRVT